MMMLRPPPAAAAAAAAPVEAVTVNISSGLEKTQQPYRSNNAYSRRRRPMYRVAQIPAASRHPSQLLRSPGSATIPESSS
uniref:Putative secreted protein n=1 Tax=Anopheles darlingi TaxID=43151 RepID=A0A2M4D9J8_ANODA